MLRIFLNDAGDFFPFDVAVVRDFSNVSEFNDAFFKREDGAILAHLGVFAGHYLNPFLADDNRTGLRGLAVMNLNPAIFRSGIS